MHKHYPLVTSVGPRDARPAWFQEWDPDSALRPSRVLVFLSEILSANTLVPIVRELQKDPDFEVDIVNDGFCVEFVRSLGLPVEVAINDFVPVVRRKLCSASLVLVGKSYVQPSEYQLLREAARYDVPVLMVIPDMGIDIVRAKLAHISAPWPTLLLADDRTANALPGLGVPSSKVVLMGNPYFDDLYARLEADRSEWSGVGLGYFSTPFQLDFERGILPGDYPHEQLVADLRTVAANLGQPLLAKRHPQVPSSLFEGMDVFEGTPLEMFRRVRVALGSYSTTLLEAYAAGIPTISYQPWRQAVREDVFRGRVPIVRSMAELQEAVVEALATPRRTEPARVTAHPGAALEEALFQVRRWARRGPLAAAG